MADGHLHAEAASSSDSDDARHGDHASAAWSEWCADEEMGSAADEQPAQSLFSPAMLPDAAAAVAHDTSEHGFDLLHYASERRLDEYGIIRCINFIRSEVAAGRDPRQQLAGAAEPPPWQDDRYLQPVLPDDALLMYDFVVDGGDLASDMQTTQLRSPATAPQDIVSQLRAQNRALRDALAASLLSSSGQGDEPDASRLGVSTSPDAPAPATQLRDERLAAGLKRKGDKHVTFSAALAAEAGRVDDTYFDSYSYFDIHREMLADKARTEAYQEALEHNPGLLHGATVLDIGCGTGILSLFAARGGASHVIGVDGSQRIAAAAQQIVAKNGMAADQGGVISIVAGKVERLGELPCGVQQADVVVSEWMGYALLFESMLESVLHARDRFLKAGGALLPDIATLHLAGVGASAGGLDFWTSVYGFNMSPVACTLREAALRDAVVAHVRPDDLVTPPVQLHSFDLATMTPSDADFTADFQIQPYSQQSAATPPATCHGVALWFDVEFSKRFCIEHPVTLSTSPSAPQTHWAQVILSFRQPVHLQQADGSKNQGGSGVATAVTGRISIARSSKHRSLDISLTYTPLSYHGQQLAAEHTCFFEMGVSG